jgi:hypothetical protein
MSNLFGVLTATPMELNYTVSATNIKLNFIQHKRESCRHIFKKFRILTLNSLYILEVLCFIKKYQGNLKQNSRIHDHNTKNKLDYTHATVTLFYIRKVWQTRILNCLTNCHHKPNNWTIIKVLKVKSFLSNNSFYTTVQFLNSDGTQWITIVINCTRESILSMQCYKFINPITLLGIFTVHFNSLVRFWTNPVLLYVMKRMYVNTITNFAGGCSSLRLCHIRFRIKRKTITVRSLCLGFCITRYTRDDFSSVTRLILIVIWPSCAAFYYSSASA